jgi:hypothetical protein
MPPFGQKLPISRFAASFSQIPQILYDKPIGSDAAMEKTQANKEGVG